MNKIIRVALTNAFKDINVDALIDVINATPNSVVATEILLGIYEHPNIPTVPGPEFIERHSSSRDNMESAGYNKFTGEVIFTYNTKRNKTGWVRKDISNPEVDDIISDAWDSSRAIKDLKIDGYPEEEFREQYHRKDIYISTEEKISSNSVELEKWIK